MAGIGRLERTVEEIRQREVVTCYSVSAPISPLYSLRYYYAQMVAVSTPLPSPPSFLLLCFPAPNYRLDHSISWFHPALTALHLPPLAFLLSSVVAAVTATRLLIS